MELFAAGFVIAFLVALHFGWQRRRQDVAAPARVLCYRRG